VPAGIGLVAGAAIGAAGGHATAEAVNPTVEDAYWRGRHRQEPYYDPNYSYEDYQGAYRTGYEGYSRWGREKNYGDVEPDLQREYEQNQGASKLRWDKARPAVRAAWDRVHAGLGRYLGYDAVDRADSKIGTVETLWSDHTGNPAFLGVKTGWIFGKTHVVPAQKVQANERDRKIRIPYDTATVKNAPAFDADSELDEAKEREVLQYYGIKTAPTEQRPPPSRPAETRG